jgi:ABC-type amino acid transport substrate-binding protein
MYYMPLHLYVRKGDARFDNNYERANQSDVKFAVIDGDISSVARAADFPGASEISVPQLSSGADLFMLVAAKKADAVELDPDTFAGYVSHNPDILRQAAGRPIRVMAVGLPIPANEPAFKSMLNTTLAYLQDSGFLEKTLKKYEPNISPLRISKHYMEP